MENLDKDRIEQLAKTRKKAHSFYSKKSKVHESFINMEQTTYKDGATEDEIIESIEVGIEMSGGPGKASARFAMNTLEYYLK